MARFPDNTGFQEVVVLVVVFVTSSLLTAIELLASPKRVSRESFPSSGPKVNLFGPPNQAQSDALVITICSRALALSFFGLALV